VPATATYQPTGNTYTDGVLSGIKWATNFLTYSFPTNSAFYEYAGGEPSNNFKAFNSAQQAATRSIFQMYASVVNLTFTELTETSTQHADLRLAESDAPGTAWAYYPSTAAAGGDAWFNNSTHYYDNPVKGEYGWLTIIHELGHAMGLKHPHEASGSFGAMPQDRDSLEYSVMSYHSYVGAPTTGYLTNEAWGYPQSLMMYDIAALQTEYGANYATNGGNTVYDWNTSTGQMFVNGVGQGAPGANRIFLTLWDGGGNDTYDFSNYTTNLNVSLQPGAWTTVSGAQLANLGGGHLAAGNIANALLYQNNPASLIENAIGGSGNDTIAGNAADNRFTGGRGNDVLDGAAGTNTAVYSGTATDYLFSQNSDGSWTVTDLRAGSPDGTDTLRNIQYLEFSGSTLALGTPSPHNSTPVAADDSYAVTRNKQLVVAGSGLLTNDTDADGDALSAVLVSNPSHGQLTLNANGTFVYTPNTQFIGFDSFTYKANDSLATSGVATVLIQIGDNTAPVATDDSYYVGLNTKLTVGAAGVLANDTDVNGDPLSAVLVSKPTQGQLKLKADGTFVYTPNKHFSGLDSFSYKSNDSLAVSGVATVLIQVGPNTAPVSTNDTFSIDQNMKLSIAGPGVLANDTDVNGDALSALLVTKPLYGTLKLKADGSFIYTPNKKFTGDDSFTYKVSDGWSTSSVATVTIHGDNTAPGATNDAYSIDQNTKLIIVGPGVLANDTDIDNDALSAVLVSKPTHGQLKLNADGSFVYTPSKTFSGLDSFSYKTSDGWAASSVATVTIQVGDNTAAVAADDAYSIGTNMKLIIAGRGVLANDTDVNGDALTAKLVSKTSHGSVSLNADGSLSYTPSKNFVGTDSFSYKVSDGRADSNVATVSITVGQNGGAGQIDLSHDQILPPTINNSPSSATAHSGFEGHFMALAHLDVFDSSDHGPYGWAAVQSWVGDHQASAVEDQSHLHVSHDAHLLLG
jgi:VCBS repeat-containing protein